jgi:transposase
LYNQKVQKIIQYEKLEDKGKIDIFRFDESGFSPTSNCPYLWSEVNNTAVVKTLSIKRINVLGFLSRNGTLKSYIADGRVDSDKVIEVFDDFTTTLTKPTVVILDNASYHKSKKFKANLSKWSARGLTLLYLPPYSPQLNIIEILWKFMKYYWIEYTAYLSYDNLLAYVKKIFNNYGTAEDEYFINFNRLEDELLETKLLPFKGE